jgi:hypothetical protein
MYSTLFESFDRFCCQDSKVGVYSGQEHEHVQSKYVYMFMYIYVHMNMKH